MFYLVGLDDVVISLKLGWICASGGCLFVLMVVCGVSVSISRAWTTWLSRSTSSGGS